jgi:hypothetical protein
MNHYEIFKGYDASNDDVFKKYLADFNTSCDEMNRDNNLKICYKKYGSNHLAVENIFKRLCKGLYEHHDPIDGIESEYIESCHNGGLTYCAPEGKYNSYGYD